MRQPSLHRASVVLCAPLQCWADPDGQVAPSLINGVYVADTRVVSALTYTCAGHEVEFLSCEELGGAQATYRFVIRTPEWGADPALLLTLVRTLSPTGLRDRLVLTNSAPEPISLRLDLALVADATAMVDIRQGLPGGRPILDAAGWSWREGTGARLDPGRAEVSMTDGRFSLQWEMNVPARGQVQEEWHLETRDPETPFGPASVTLTAPSAGDDALGHLLGTAWADMNALLMADRDAPGDAFLAAGAPWYFTLFGRDSLIAARMLLPYHPDLAYGTLRSLARRQGVIAEASSAQQPGKIPHEVRREALILSESHRGEAPTIALPPVYYGTIDATCLWIMLVGDLFDAGHAIDEFTPGLEAALRWLADDADADGDGFVEYRDQAGTGLVNQGWKDSSDSMRFRDGSQAQAPIALAEVQGYAYAAAQAAARILEHRGDTARSEQWRSWAGALAQRFRERFWVRDDLGPYPALALDKDKRPVDGCASNMGHLLGTGMLNSQEARHVVERLLHPRMFTGYGIRTLSSDNPGYAPLGYHVGSVWAHDTALCADGMRREGFVTQAAAVASGLLRAAEGFRYRLPELFGGQPAPGHAVHGESGVWPPVPYPAACRPQAWSAASAAIVWGLVSTARTPHPQSSSS